MYFFSFHVLLFSLFFILFVLKEYNECDQFFFVFLACEKSMDHTELTQPLKVRVWDMGFATCLRQSISNSNLVQTNLNMNAIDLTHLSCLLWNACRVINELTCL